MPQAAPPIHAMRFQTEALPAIALIIAPLEGGKTAFLETLSTQKGALRRVFSGAPAVQRVALEGRDPQPVPGDLKRQDSSTVVADSCGYPAGGAVFHQKNHAASASCAASFGSPAAVSGRHTDQLVYERSGNSGRIGAAQLPLLAQQACDLIPVSLEQCLMHIPRNADNSFEVAEYSLVAVNVGFEDFPVVDARLPRRAGV